MDLLHSTLIFIKMGMTFSSDFSLLFDKINTISQWTPVPWDNLFLCNLLVAHLVEITVMALQPKFTAYAAVSKAIMPSDITRCSNLWNQDISCDSMAREKGSDSKWKCINILIERKSVFMSSNNIYLSC